MAVIKKNYILVSIFLLTACGGGGGGGGGGTPAILAKITSFIAVTVFWIWLWVNAIPLGI